jgi:hypothetical protein
MSISALSLALLLSSHAVYADTSSSLQPIVRDCACSVVLCSLTGKAVAKPLSIRSYEHRYDLSSLLEIWRLVLRSLTGIPIFVTYCIR